MRKLLYWILVMVIAASTSATAQENKTQDAEALFRSAFAEACHLDDEFTPAAYFPTESWTLTWQPKYSDSEHNGTLHQFFCSAGAYNVNLVYYFDHPFSGLMPVAFAVPLYDVEYENEQTGDVVKSLTIRGFSAQFILTNSEFDPAANAIRSFSKSRGLGDASHGGYWVFDDGNFVLKYYDVDASYDGEINSERIVEFE